MAKRYCIDQRICVFEIYPLFSSFFCLSGYEIELKFYITFLHSNFGNVLGQLLLYSKHWSPPNLWSLSIWIHENKIWLYKHYTTEYEFTKLDIIKGLLIKGSVLDRIVDKNLGRLLMSLEQIPLELISALQAIIVRVNKSRKVQRKGIK